VTSTGQYVIAWDFAKVKKGQMDKYEIKKYEDLVVQDNFRFGDDKEIVRPFMTGETVRSLIAFVVDCRITGQCSQCQKEEPPQAHTDVACP
jgi:hypothetical protein